MSKRIIAQLAKAPVQGMVKTRMQPALNVEQSQLLHQGLVELVVASVAEYKKHDGDVHHQLWCSAEHDWFTHLSCSSEFIIKAQAPGDLGQRLASITASQLAPNTSLILIGSDCPFIEPDIYSAMFEDLESGDWDLVIIPAFDGGYAALALKEAHCELFEAIPGGGGRSCR
ncbi:MAG: glycosyltransferase A (GT-A) superfamily protein (DUF2064 family) [Flavobacteriales bacterium]|jgi:glycosyltransferase A (GT-A) superfamily protein (DUF2064 family)